MKKIMVDGIGEVEVADDVAEQLYADQPEVDSEVVEEEEVAAEEEIPDDLQPEEATVEPEVKKPDRTVPLAVLTAQRAKDKEKADKLQTELEATRRELEMARLEDQKRKIESQTEANIAEGVPEKLAREHAELKFKTVYEMERMKDQTIEIQMDALRTEEFYSDIDSKRKDIREYARTKNVSVKEAYNALYAGERATEIAKRQVEKAIAELTKGKSAAIAQPFGSQTPVQKKNLNLSKDQIEAAQNGKMSPDVYARLQNAEMTAHDYIRMKQQSKK
jgi:hypothetical protein